MLDKQKQRETILVTGARSGIGAAVCRSLLDQGYAVVGLSRSISDTAFENANFSALRCDMCDHASLASQIKVLLKTDIDLAGAVFCAGSGYFGGLEQLDFTKVEALLNLNLLSPMFLSKLLIPGLKRRGAGHLIYLGSEAALQGARNGSAYCASKFGLRGFVQSLREECRQSGLSVSLINPGMVDTPFFDDLQFTPGEDASNRISPEAVAACVASIFASEANSIIEEINLSPRNKVVRNKKIRQIN